MGYFDGLSWLSPDQSDCLQEIANIAMGRAGDSLARFLKVFIRLSVPRIGLIQRAELIQNLREIVGERKPVWAVRQGFYNAQGNMELRGEAIVIFSQASFEKLAVLMAYDQDLDAEAEVELLLDITNILNGACLGGIAEQLAADLFYSPPSVIGRNTAMEAVLDQERIVWNVALLVEINYTLEDHSFTCDLLLLMPDNAIRAVIRAVDNVLVNL